MPQGFAYSTLKDYEGNDIIDFDLRYFDSFAIKQKKDLILKSYPSVIQKAYRDYRNGKKASNIFQVPSDIGVCFQLYDGRPPFLNAILASMKYDAAVETERTRGNEEVQKILVQKIPHLTDGRLLFEPDEVAEMHAGAVGMMKGNPNVRVLTTYGEVDAIGSKTSADHADAVLARVEQNIFAQAGVSGQIFSSTNSSTIKQSLQNDLSFVMYLANRYSFYITNVINAIFGSKNISFKYTILPVSHYNTEDYFNNNYKLLSSGYSAIIPALVIGINQKDLVDLKDLENDVLGLVDKLKPLQSAYTQSSGASSNQDNEGGRPAKETEDKKSSTIAKDESLAGGND